MNDLRGAPCRGQSDLFQSTHWADHLEAATLCADCPVFAACDAQREYEVATTRRACTTPAGTWAGQLYGAPKNQKPRECGTDRGYYQHRYQSEHVCAACRKAHAAANLARVKRASA